MPNDPTWEETARRAAIAQEHWRKMFQTPSKELIEAAIADTWAKIAHQGNNPNGK